MTTYFPYSQIINEICTHFEKSISRTSYSDPWAVTGSEIQETAKPSYGSISELYY